MGKNKKENVSSYDSEMMEDSESGYESEPNGKPAIREVNRANVLNYQSDDSDESEIGQANSDEVD